MYYTVIKLSFPLRLELRLYLSMLKKHYIFLIWNTQFKIVSSKSSLAILTSPVHNFLDVYDYTIVPQSTGIFIMFIILRFIHKQC